MLCLALRYFGWRVDGFTTVDGVYSLARLRILCDCFLALLYYILSSDWLYR